MRKLLLSVGRSALLLLAFLSLYPKANSQDFNYKRTFTNFEYLSDSKKINFEAEGIEAVKTDFPIFFDNESYSKIYISKEGWISFSPKTNFQNFHNGGYTSSFITPLLFETPQEFKASYKNDAEKITIEWKNDFYAFQAVLFQDGDIVFNYEGENGYFREMLERTKYSIAVVNSKTAIGYFYDTPPKEKTEIIESVFANNNNTLIFEYRLKNKTNTTQKTLAKNASKATNTYPTPGTYTWTCPVGVTEVTVHCYAGGGGGGAGGGTNKEGGGGGGGGAYSTATVPVTAGTDYTVVVGAGGTSGLDGGNSSFDGTTVIAYGGQAGATGPQGAGGTGGTGTYNGGNGATAPSQDGGAGGGGAGNSAAGGNASGTTAGTGGNANGGAGGAGITANDAPGNDGADYGGGGSGGTRNSAGGTGGQGYVSLDYTVDMTFVSSTTTQNNTTTVVTGTTEAEIIGIEVVTTGSANPLDLTSFTLNANGTTDIADLTGNAKIYYTGTSNTFATTTLFGQNAATIANFDITGTQTLAEGTNYFWLVYDVDASATVGNFLDGECVSITVDGSSETPTATAPAGNREIIDTPPFDGTFSSGTDFISNGMIVANDGTNYWIVGTATHNGAPNSAYITDDGSSNSYNNATTQVSHFYIDYTFPAGITNIELSFDWKCDGEGSYDNLKVYMVETTTTPVGGTELGTGQISLGYYSEQTTWQSEVIAIAEANAGTTKRIVFTWDNDGSFGTDPPIAVDNIEINYLVPAACSGTPAPGTISSDITEFCSTGTPTLTAAGYETGVSGITLQWQSSPDGSTWTDIAGATSDTYASPEITETTYYQLVVTCTNSGNSDVSNTVTVTNTSETITSTNSPVNIACSSTATLTATASGGTISWWDSETGGTELATGGSYTTPAISGDVTYYVSTSDGGGATDNVGKASSDLSDGYYGSTGTGVVFDAFSSFTLISVDVYVQTAGSDVIINHVNSSGTVLNTQTFASCPAGHQTLTLNFNITPGTDYRLVSGNSTSLARDFTGVTWPYTLTGVCSITGGWLSSASTSYYFMYNWVVSSDCESERVPVDVVVTSGTTAPDCSNLISPANNANTEVSGVTLNWDASLTDCQHASGYKLFFGTDNPPTNIVNGTDLGDVLTYDPGVLNAPETYYWQVVPTNSAGDATGCEIRSFNTSLSVVIGDGTTNTTVTPYQGYNENGRMQIIYYADELIAAGILPGTTFTGLAFDVASKNSTLDYTDLTVKMCHTAETQFVATWLPDTWTVVQNANNYTTVADWNSHSFDNSFVWNGTDNIGVEVCFDNIDWSSDDPVFYTATTEYTVAYAETDTDGEGGCGLPEEWRSTSRPNIKFTYIPVIGENTITAGAGVESVTIPSTIDTQGEAVLNFDFTVNDDGTTPATDNDKTLISQITIRQGIGNDVADWSSTIAGAELSDDEGNTQTADITITATSIIISNIDFGNNQLGEIDDNASKTYSLKIWLNCPSTELIEGQNFVFEVTNASFLLGASSSYFALGEEENSGATNNAYIVTGTQLSFIEQPTDTEVSMYMFPRVQVALTDDCGNVDEDYTGTVSLSSTGTMTGDPISVSLVNGIAEFDVLHTVIGTNLTLTATSGAMNVTSDPFDIIIKECSVTTTPAHTNGELFICEGETIDFAGTYSGGGTVDSWTWRMGDGNELTTQNVSNYAYTPAAGYYAELTVNYTDGTSGSCATAVRVMVSGGPQINNVSPDMETCESGTYDLSASGTSGDPVEVAGYSGSGAVALSLAEETYLPDTETDFTTYTTVLEYTQFDPTATLTAANLVTIYANMEHSYFGDLEIELHCPNGQSVHLADGNAGSGNTGAFLGEPVDDDLDPNTAGVGYEYRWTEVSPTYPEMSSATLPTYSYTDNSGNSYTSKEYFPADTYAPLDAFAGLVGCPLNGEWTLEITDHIGSDNGYIFEWGLELDNSLMPGSWDYTAEIVSYKWSGAGLDAGYTTGPDVTVTPPNLGDNTYNILLTDEYGCTSDQDVNVKVVVCNGNWTGDVNTDWDNTGNWANGQIPTCAGTPVTIPDVSGDSGNFPYITVSAEANNMTIEAGANVTIAPTGSLTVCGTLTNDQGIDGIVIESSALGTGSLIHNTADVSGTINSYLLGTRYHYISSPMEAATTAGAGVQGTQIYAWYATMEWLGVDLNHDGATTLYDNDYAPWHPETPFSGTMGVATGYAYYYETSSLSYEGEFNVGDYNITCHKAAVVTTPEATDSEQGWNLLGNPYPASLNWDDVAAASPNIESALYLFSDDGTGFQANYQYYVPGGGGSPYGIGTVAASEFVPPGQGFFVRADDEGDVVNINASHREHSTQVLYKGDETPDNLMRFVIQNETNQDEMILRLLDVATLDFDGRLDARKLKPANPDIPLIYMIDAEQTEMAINSISTDVDGVVLPVVVSAPEGSMTIKATEQTLKYGSRVYLVDKYLNTETEMYANTEYEFIFAGGVNEERFELKFEVNNAPIVTQDLENKTTLEDDAFSYTLPEALFADSDENDILVYQAKLSNASSLPSWLNFDAATLTFSGTPENDHVGNYALQITATDEFGETASATFNLEVVNTNDAPVLANPFEDMELQAEELVTFKIDDFTFIDVDAGDILTYSASCSQAATLPMWLEFDATTKTFTANPKQSDVGEYSIAIYATDLAGAFDFDVFDIKIFSTTDIIENNQNLNISPNPTDGFFSMEIPKSNVGEYQVEIYDNTGKLIMNLNTSYNVCEIDLSGYPSGVYSISVKTGEKVYNRKVVIQ